MFILDLRDYGHENFLHFQKSCTAERLLEASKFQTAEDQKRSWAAGWLLNQCIQKHEDLPHRSLSHSGPYVLCAVHTLAVGADLESIPGSSLGPQECTELASDFWPHGVFQAWKALIQADWPEAERQFLKEWTLRESWAKLWQIPLDEVLKPDFIPPAPYCKTETLESSSYVARISWLDCTSHSLEVHL